MHYRNYISLSYFASLDIPGPVGVPFTAENLTSESCKLNWFFPDDDGGSAISNYIIEKREAERKAWTSCSYTAGRQNAIVNNLVLKKAYFFRVAAENAIGVGPFNQTACEIVIKDRISKYLSLYIIFLVLKCKKYMTKLRSSKNNI